jgi:hypothetical protein
MPLAARRAFQVKERLRLVKCATRRLPSTWRPRELRNTSTVTVFDVRRAKRTRSRRPLGRAEAERKPTAVAHATAPLCSNVSERPQPASVTVTGPSVSTCSAAAQVSRARAGLTVTVETLRAVSFSTSARLVTGVAPQVLDWLV